MENEQYPTGILNGIKVVAVPKTRYCLGCVFYPGPSNIGGSCVGIAFSEEEAKQFSGGTCGPRGIIYKEAPK